MSNYGKTFINCSNPEVIKFCAAALQEVDDNGCEDWKDGDTELRIDLRTGVPHDEVKAISKEFPDETIICEYSYWCDDFSIVYHVEHKNGKDRIVNIEPAYMHTPLKLHNQNDSDGICHKVICFCRKLDTTEKDKDGKLSLNWFPGEVCFIFEYEGEYGIKYQVEATKQHNYLDIKIFEGSNEFDWPEISRDQHPLLKQAENLI